MIAAATADEAKTKPKSRLQTKRDAKQARIAARERFKRAHRAERSFSRQLNSVANQVDHIVRAYTPKNASQLINWPQLNAALHKYADLLQPWAKAVSEKLIAEVGSRDERAWASMGRDIGRNLRAEIRNAPTGKIAKQLLEEQVSLITSLPLEAAQRVHKIAQGFMTEGTRAKQLQAEILETGEVTKARAMLIARTETTRSATALTEARAQYIGSEGYIWRTAKDGDVRKEHKKLEGKFFRWDDPPVTGSNGERSHPGAIYNCRCYPEVIVPDSLD